MSAQVATFEVRYLDRPASRVAVEFAGRYSSEVFVTAITRSRADEDDPITVVTLLTIESPREG